MTIIVYGQTDTTVNGIHYNSIDYYDNGHLMTLGNYRDSVKAGRWTYFKIDGQVLAYGLYKNGHKIKKWTYYYNRKKHKVNWGTKNPPNENIELDEKGQIVIYNSVFRSPCLWSYKNGVVTSIALL